MHRDLTRGFLRLIVRPSHYAFDRWERFSRGWGGAGLMFAWSAAEATVWPIIPDFLLAPMAVGARRQFIRPLFATVAGSSLGGAALYLFALHEPRKSEVLLQHLPLTPPGQIQVAQRQISRRGTGAFLLQPWSGVPLKVWIVAAASAKLNPVAVVPTFIAGRAARMGLVAVGAGLLGDRLARIARDFFIVVAGTYLVLFSLGYRKVLEWRK